MNISGFRPVHLPLILTLSALLLGCPPKVEPVEPVKVSFILTNDIHGYLAPGLTYLSSIAQQIRNRSEYKDEKAALFVIDSGDQFQGTLMSNYDEGLTTFKVLNQIGYDAIIPGNHDYDFGPMGWLFDRVTPGKTSDDNKEVIKALAKTAKFPMLSANTYTRASLKSGGVAIEVDHRCAPSKETPRASIDFSAATRPSFLSPYLILKRAGVRVALIGIDHKDTSTTTTAENVSDLCFRDEVDTYLDVRKSLEDKADIFVMLLHNGNAPPSDSWEGSRIAEAINETIPDGVDLVASGHTHMIYNMISGGVPVIQDGAKGKAYGRVDLYFDPETRTVLKDQTKAAAGIPLEPNRCDAAKHTFACEELSFPIASDPVIDALIQKQDEILAPVAKRKITTASETVKINRINESALGNLFADILKRATKTDIAIMNAGGIRTDIQAGDVLYDELYEVSPFQNQVVVIDEVPWPVFKEAFRASIHTCGEKGTLVQSGFRIQYTRTCSEGKPTSKLLHVETVDGEVLYDFEKGIDADKDRTFSLAILDFIASGSGESYSMFKGLPLENTVGIARELIIDQLSQENLILNNTIDQRYQNLTP